MPLRRTVYCVFAVLLGVTLGACSTFDIEGKKIDYKSAGKLPPLEVPPDLTRPTHGRPLRRTRCQPQGHRHLFRVQPRAHGPARQRGRLCVLPQQDRRAHRARRQPALAGGQGHAGTGVAGGQGFLAGDWLHRQPRDARGGRDGDRLGGEPRRISRTSVCIRGFLGRFLDQTYPTSERDKFRTRLERGTEPGTTEIYISHRGMEEVYTSQQSENMPDTRWQPRPPDPELEAEMLGRLMVRFGVEDSRAKAQLASGSTTAPQRATLSKGADGAEHSSAGRAVRPRVAARRALRSTASASRSRTATVPRGSTSCATSIRRSTTARRLTRRAAGSRG